MANLDRKDHFTWWNLRGILRSKKLWIPLVTWVFVTYFILVTHFRRFCTNLYDSNDIELKLCDFWQFWKRDMPLDEVLFLSIKNVSAVGFLNKKNQSFNVLSEIENWFNWKQNKLKKIFIRYFYCQTSSSHRICANSGDGFTFFLLFSFSFSPSLFHPRLCFSFAFI